MSKRFFHISALVTVLLSLASVPAYAQTDAPKLELGAQFSLMRLRDLGETDPGVGGRITYNFNDNIAVESEFNFFPRDLGFSQYRSQGLFGVKAGIRSNTAGIFAKVRPGFMRFHEADSPIGCIGIFPPPLACKLSAGSTQFALDIGGVFELYPSRGTVVRFDLGDSIIRFGGPILGAPDGFTSHNLQFNVGFGFRF